jgi:carboxyl-terminal processing protease
VVSYVYFEAPAYQKLFPGDTIIGLKHTESMYFDTFTSTEDVLQALKGQQFDEKTLIVKNPDDVIREVTIIYDYIPMTNVEIKQFNASQVSYVSIHEFTPYVDADNPGTAQSFKDAIEYLEEHGLDDNGTLIIDLRDNPGGSVSALHNLNFPNYPVGIIQQLIPYESTYPAFQMTDYDGNVTTFRGGLPTPKPYDIVVLVNENTASASEVLAAALQQQGYAIYGEATFGKYVYQNQYPLTQLNDIEYVLVYTEGIWTYKDGVTVLEDPIDVIALAPHPYHAMDRLTYDGMMKIDMVNETLIPFQQFLNIYYDSDVREDGYFDTETEQLVRTFQGEYNLTVNGFINEETYHKMYDLYNVFTQDLNYDSQLETLVELLS